MIFQDRPTHITSKTIYCLLFLIGMNMFDLHSTGVWILTILSVFMVSSVRYTYTSDIPPHMYESDTHATRDRYIQSHLKKSEWTLAMLISICIGGTISLIISSSLWGIFPVIIGGYNIASAIQWVQYFARTP